MSSPEAEACCVWAKDPATFSNVSISEINHSFDSHPLMQLPRLAELARSLYSTKQCRFIKRGATQNSEFHHEARSYDGHDIDEVFERIAEPGSWIALYNIETDPEYAIFLESVVDAARPLLEKEHSGIHTIQGFLFISTPPSVTPFHIDRENNLWLQIRGRKVISVWDHRDRSIVPASTVEHFIMYGGLEDVRLTDKARAKAHDFAVTAGTGVYFPSTSPHMTATECRGPRATDNVSISVGVVFYTDQTRRVANAHILNHYLRRLGLSPTYPGESKIIDALKYPLARVLVWVLSRFRGFEPKPGIVPVS